MAELGLDTQVALLAAGAMFTWALLLGVEKYRQILASPEGAAHPYIDIAHRAALMYSFALVLIAVFAELSAWSVGVDLAATAVLAFYFAAAVASYMWHGLRRDTTNQLRHPSGLVRGFMVTLIVGEVGGFLVLFAGVIAAL